MVQYLVGHSDVKAIIALGEQPLDEALPSLQEAKLKVPVGGFDLSKDILDAIGKGDIVATVDQQPYSQGFFTVQQLALKNPIRALSLRHEDGRSRAGGQDQLSIRGKMGGNLSLNGLARRCLVSPEPSALQ